ncbi:MAG: histidinol dehydrogenase, partial [Anaerovorax sp.]
MIKTICADGIQEVAFLKNLQERRTRTNEDVGNIVAQIIQEVKTKGDVALRKFSLQFDGGCPQDLQVPTADMKQAFEQADPAFKAALVNAAANIRFYHQHQKEQDYRIEKEQGVVLGQLLRGLSRVGVYVPGGTAAYPSTVLMNIIPAKLAGVEEIVMVTPPMVSVNGCGEKTYGANPDILAAAYVAGADRIFLTGGAQSIAALTYGTETIPRVDKIVGPGNIFVATAKRLLYGQVDIDMIAGPSEILIIADEFAKASYVAADLMSQAEHDKMAASILLTTDEKLAENTVKEIQRQMALLGRQEIIEASLKEFGVIIICQNTQQMIDISNEIAPEHLEIMMKDPMAYLPKIKNAGSVFCGDFSPEPLGDYYGGTNHVLPTSGTARFSSPLGVYSFVKKMSYT